MGEANIHLSMEVVIHMGVDMVVVIISLDEHSVILDNRMLYYSLFILILPHIVSLIDFSVTKLFQVSSNGRMFFLTME